MIRAVLFDLDDTLFDHRHGARAALEGVRALHPGFHALDPADFERSHAAILENLHLEVLAGRLELDAARVERFRRLYRASGIEADAELSARTAILYRDRYIAARIEVRGAAALLAAVRERARVVIVSNNLGAEQRAKMRDCGLDRHVDLLVASEEVGISKPDPRIFSIALERVGVRAAEAVMVGDSWANDIEGARAAGIRAIWFDRDGGEPSDPTVEVIRALEPAAEALRTIFRETAPEGVADPPG